MVAHTPPTWRIRQPSGMLIIGAFRQENEIVAEIRDQFQAGHEIGSFTPWLRNSALAASLTCTPAWASVRHLASRVRGRAPETARQTASN
jgi:hypothetical protein